MKAAGEVPPPRKLRTAPALGLRAAIVRRQTSSEKDMQLCGFP
jgi:hypothetical protein